MSMEGPQGRSSSFADCRESQRCAAVLGIGVLVIIVLALVVSAVYLSGILAPQVPAGEWPRYWGLRVADFIAESGWPTGSQWAARLHQGDVLTILPGILLASLSAVCLAAILPIYLRRRDWAYAVIVLLQLGLIALAATRL